MHSHRLLVVAVLCGCWLLGAVNARSSSKHSTKKQRAEELVSQAVDLEQDSATDGGLLPWLVEGMTHFRAHQSRDLELRSSVQLTEIEGELYGRMYDVLAKHISSPENVGLPREGVLNCQFWSHLPPLKALATGIEQFRMVAGGDVVNTVNVKTLKEAYKETMNAELSDAQAKRLLVPLMVDKKSKIEVNKCEFVTALLTQAILDKNLREGSNTYFHQRKAWTVKDLKFELGWGHTDDLTTELYQRIVLDEIGKKDDPSLSQCSFSLLLALERDATFRAFVAPAHNLKQFTPKPGMEMEQFMGLEMYVHTADDLVAFTQWSDKLLGDLFLACDHNGDGELAKTEFTSFVAAQDRWKDLVNPLAVAGKSENQNQNQNQNQPTNLEQEDGNKPQENGAADPSQNTAEVPAAATAPKMADGFESTKLLENPMQLADDKEWEHLWQQVAGKKAHYMTSKQLHSYLLRSLSRAKLSHSPEVLLDFRTRYQLTKFHDSINKHKNTRLMKPEMRLATFGRSQLVPYLTAEDVKQVISMLVPTETTVCDRSCWTVLSPLIDVFNILDGNNDGELSKREFSQLGVSTLSRLRAQDKGKMQYPSLHASEIGLLFEAALKSHGGEAAKGCGLPCFAFIFKQNSDKSTKVVLHSFLDPPFLKEIRNKQPPASKDKGETK